MNEPTLGSSCQALGLESTVTPPVHTVSSWFVLGCSVSHPGVLSKDLCAMKRAPQQDFSHPQESQ